MQKLILLQDIEDLGNAGDIVNVADGYARNFLVPKGYAIEESPAALRQLASRKGKIDEQRQLETGKAGQVAEKISALELVITAQASDDKQLFGSVSPGNISDELAKHGIEIEARRIHLDSPIKEIGEYLVKVKVHKDIFANLKLKIVKA